MEFNSLFFPAPSVHYSVNTHFGEMIYIPKDYKMTLDERTRELVPKLDSRKISSNFGFENERRKDLKFKKQHS